MARIADDADTMKAQAVELALKTGLVSQGDLAIVITGSSAGGSYSSECIQIFYV